MYKFCNLLNITETLECDVQLMIEVGFDACQIKSFSILDVLRRSVNEVAGPISVSLRLGNTTPFEEMSQP